MFCNLLAEINDFEFLDLDCLAFAEFISDLYVGMGFSLRGVPGTEEIGGLIVLEYLIVPPIERSILALGPSKGGGSTLRVDLGPVMPDRDGLDLINSLP